MSNVVLEVKVNHMSKEFTPGRSDTRPPTFDIGGGGKIVDVSGATRPEDTNGFANHSWKIVKEAFETGRLIVGGGVAEAEPVEARTEDSTSSS